MQSIYQRHMPSQLAAGHKRFQMKRRRRTTLPAILKFGCRILIAFGKGAGLTIDLAPTDEAFFVLGTPEATMASGPATPKRVGWGSGRKQTMVAAKRTTERRA